MKKNKYFFFLFCCLILSSCATVKPYQRAFLNDRDMQFGKSLVVQPEQHIHLFREAAMGGSGGKSSGGCGCN